MRRKRPVRPKRPYTATPDQVRITRDSHGALISYAEENVSGVHLGIAPEELAGMSDEDILAVHNHCIEAQEASAAAFEWVAVEVPPGTPQVKRDRRSGRLVPRGDVLRCHITDGSEVEGDPVSIYIDDQEYTLREFGEVLSMYAGWGMRVAFVPDDEVYEEPAIEVRKPKRGR
jgi:hypothetical protein